MLLHRPLIIGHACAAGEAPANTLAGVRACLDAGAEAMEIDVRLSADGVAILMHDETVDRTTNLTGPVRDLPLAVLQAADAGEGEPVPTLDQVLDLVAGRLSVLCELKSTPVDPEYDQALVDAVLNVIEKHRAGEWTAIHSFNGEMIDRARQAEPLVSAAIISMPRQAEEYDQLLSAVLVRNAQAVSLEHSCVDREHVVAAKRRQLTIWTWTVDNEADWERVTEAGVDGIITNVPHRLRDWLRARGGE